MRQLNVSKLQALQKFAPVVLGVLLCWLSWQIAHIFWLLVAPAKAPIIQPAMAASNSQNMPSLAGANLFKEQSQTVVADTIQPDIAMKLEGVFVGTTGQSAAIISAVGKSKQYRVGDTIEGSQSILSSVGWDYVILRRGGGMDSASLAKLKFGDSQPSPLAARNVDTPPAMPTAASNMSNGRFGGLMGNSRFGGRVGAPALVGPNQVENMLNSAVSRLRTDPAGYLNEIGVSATSRGYELTAGVPRNIASQLGLRAGDVVTMVNGVPVGNISQDVALLERIKAEHSAQITVQRGQQSVTIQQDF